MIGDYDALLRLRRNEQRLEIALAAARLGSWELDLRTGRLTATAQCKANHGFAADVDMQLRPHLVEALDAQHRQAFLAAIDAAIATRGSFELELPNRWPDGSEHWLMVAGRVADEQCMVGVSQDITDRRRAEQQLRDVDRRKDEFLAVLGHELRAPLAPILTAVKLLDMKGPSDPSLQKLRSTILRQTLQLSTLVDELLDVGYITAGKLRLDRQRIDLRDVLTQAVEVAVPAIDRRQHALTVSLPDSPVYANADRARLVQATGNLLVNAAKYSPDRSRIELVLREHDGIGVVSVRDNGTGLPPDMLAHVFERFVQAGAAGDRGESGLGIGLSVVKAVVELHGGSVEAHSEGPGKGSIFTFRVPLAS